MRQFGERVAHVPASEAAAPRLHFGALDRRMRSLDALVDEHRAITAMLSIVEAATSRLERGENVPPDLFPDALDFFENFAGGCHHAKEEDVLFPLLAAHGLGPETGPLLAQHDAARFQLRHMRAAVERLQGGDPQARDALIPSTRAYVDLLRAHIRLEDDYYYPLAAQGLSPGEDQRLLDRFDEIERTRTGAGERDRYRRMIAACQDLVATW